MPRRHKLAFFGLSILTLVAVGRAVTGSFGFLTADFWFTSGLLLVILLSIVDQPHFSKDANIFVNGVAGLLSLAAVPVAARNFLWHVFFAWSLWLVASSYGIMIVRSRELKREAGVVQIVSRINRDIGRPEAIFSAFFLWGIFAQFSQNSVAFRALLLFWATFFILNLRGVSSTLGRLLTSRLPATTTIDGVVTSFISPRIVLCELDASLEPLPPGSTIELIDGDAVLATAAVTDDRVLQRRRFARAVLTFVGPGWTAVAEPAESRAVQIRILSREVDTRPVAAVGVGSSIGTLRFTINPDADLVEGEVVAVELRGGHRAYYQVVAASLKDETVAPESLMHEVEVTATQLGVWNDSRCRFEAVSWVAPAGGLVQRVALATQIHTIPEGHVRLGVVPNSAFPVHVSLSDIVTHNTAIIGVTGSGKSYLSFLLIESMARAGVKVLVLDISRQHWIFLQRHNPYAVKKSDAVQKWLESDQNIGVYQFAESQNYAKTTADMVQNVFDHLANTVTLRAGENEPARICIVFEEAHSLIPEWNQVAQEGDKAQVNRTARTILQGRKYGMGSIVVTQRTANVTKTILNQCNTLIALQSFDQTGLDFMANYMGAQYANVISTLPTQHAIIVGKASSSLRPVMFRVVSMDSYWAPEEVNEQSVQDGAG